MRKLLFGMAIVSTMAFRPQPLEPHPHIRGAITELQEARKELQSAAHDFGGHRVEAIRAIDVAIRQLREAQRFDK